MQIKYVWNKLTDQYIIVIFHSDLLLPYTLNLSPLITVTPQQFQCM